MRFMQTESVLQTKNRSEPAKNRFSVALIRSLVSLPLHYMHMTLKNIFNLRNKQF